uniref:Uncharacterized protein n=1 Tax=Anguilla anguilla TaxID=7936 RepID=A0A0E9RNG5_ANGAN
MFLSCFLTRSCSSCCARRCREHSTSSSHILFSSSSL